MRKIIRKILVLMVALIAWGNAWGHDFVTGGIYYNITSETDLTVEVTYGLFSFWGRTFYSGDIVIPSSVTYSGKTYSVTSIGVDAFYKCDGLTSITIPNSVTSIGKDAFYNCDGLTSITIPNSVTSIGNQAFYYCDGLTSITIPNSVTSIGDGAFYYCDGLTSITIPNSVTSIGNDAFRNCTGLTSITIPNSVTSIGSQAFSGTGWYNGQAYGLIYLDNWLLGYKGTEPSGHIDIKDGTKNIAGGAFRNCSGLTSITIPNSVTSIGKDAFYNCSGLTSITIPNSVTSIGHRAFYACDGLTSITIPNSVTSIGDDAFRDCTGLTSITIPNSVTSIANYAFANCTGLTSITIPNSVTSIGKVAFANCDGLTSITIPNSVTSIGEDAFNNCDGLTSITIGNSVTSIGEDAFYSCDGLKLVINFSELTIGRRSSSNGYVGYYADRIINADDQIGDFFFIIDSNGNPFLSNYIGNDTDLSLPENYKGMNYAILNDAFANCTGLTSITIPNSVTSIENYVFYNCDGLTSITIGNSVTSIGNYAFYDCDGLTNIMVENGNTVYDSRENCNAIIETTTNTLIVGCKNTLIPNSVTSIGYGAFRNCTGLTSITIPNSVTSIGESAFWECSNLISITIPNSVTSIGNQAFCDCSGLTSITIPNSVTSIGKNVFSGCENLTSIKVEEGNPIYESRDENHAIVQKSDNSVVAKIPREISVCVASSTQTTLTLQVLHEESKSFESCGIEVGFHNKYEADSDGYIVLTEKVPNKSGSISSITEVYAIYDGISYTVEKVNNLEYTTKDITAEVIVQSSPTTVTLSGNYDVGDATFEASGFTLPQSVEGNTLALTGLEPGISTEVSYYVTVKEGNYTKTVTQTVTTPALKMTTLPAKATSNTKAVICAETNIINEETGTGFEFRRIDAPDLVPSTVVYCAVHDGVMEGILNNLSSNTYYQYRPFYKSASGKMYYGDWIGFGTADAYVYFTPTVHTYATAGIANNSVTLNGYALAGSDDILEQGFEYWTDGFVGTRAAGEVMTVAATGQRMSITLNDLQYNTTYRYRAYVKTAKETTYGEEMSFTTGADPAGIGEMAAEDLEVEVRTVQGGIELRLTSESATARYALYTLNGTSIANGQLTSGEEWQHVGDASLPQGLYLLRVENNKLCRTVKVMVK